MTIKEIIQKLNTTMTDACLQESHFEYCLILNEGIIDAIDALKALDKQEPVAWEQFYPDIGKPKFVAQTEQEPVAKYSDIVSDGGLDPRKTVQPQPDQEPIKDWIASNNAICALLRQAHDALALTSYPPQRAWVGLDWLPKHRCGLHLSHNEHRDAYETVEQFYDSEDFISQEEWHEAVAKDSVWVLHWYPETPIGFHRIAASTLEAIEAKLKDKSIRGQE